ncbi:hypothetical protein ACOYW6_10710 [Parablastomonas sp. CN1-191]|uniref:hypothetical protein n=1 Tax=Parablastomonas sp. CN1-191 TaxID=3400908 RepID=UPI003BF85F95
MRLPIALLAAVAAPALYAVPAAAQDAAGDKVNTVIIYGDDKCPPSTSDTITVCARLPDGERYRIPEELRTTSGPQSEAWVNKVIAYEAVTKTGTMSCSTVGPGGSTGCTQKMIQQAYAEKKTAPGVRFGQLIEAEREKRLATIDADAAKTQADVEKIEDQYEQRAAAAATPATTPATTPAPAKKP